MHLVHDQTAPTPVGRWGGRTCALYWRVPHFGKRLVPVGSSACAQTRRAPVGCVFQPSLRTWFLSVLDGPDVWRTERVSAELWFLASPCPPRRLQFRHRARLLLVSPPLF